MELKVILLVVALVAFVVAALLAFGVFSGISAFGVACIGFACWVLSAVLK